MIWLAIILLKYCLQLFYLLCFHNILLHFLLINRPLIL